MFTGNVSGKMTVFYNKRLGIVKEVFSGEEDFSVFGDEGQDIKQIWGRLVTKFDQLIFAEKHRFFVEDNKLKMKPEEIPERYR